jgi:hypothetical protein
MQASNIIGFLVWGHTALKSLDNRPCDYLS